MKYAWIAAQGKAYSLTEMCDVLDVSISGYRAWKREIVVTTLAQNGIACEVAPLVDAHGGRVTASNPIDGGALFRVEFPRAEPGAQTAPTVDA